MAKKPKRTNYPNRTSTGSANETTGAIPAKPQTEDEYEAYEDIVPTAVPPKRGRKGNS